MAAQNFEYRDSTGKRKNGFGLQVSAGGGSAGALAALNSAGQIDTTMLPTGLDVATRSIVTSENLAAGAFVSLYSNSGTLTARNADNSAVGKEAIGFVLSAVTSPAAATVYLLGQNSGLTGLTIGSRYYLGTIGTATLTPPDPTNIANAGKFIQELGFADSTTEVSFAQGSEPTYL